MRAAELLSAISKPVYTQEFEGIYISEDSHFLPITHVDKKENKLIFSTNPTDSPIAMGKLLKILMLNKRCELFLNDGEKIIRVYGYKEVGDKIVL